MAWTAKIAKVETFYGAVNLTVTISQDSPAVSYTTQVGFNNTTDLDRARVITWIKGEIARVSALYDKAQTLAADVNVTITP